MTSSRNKPLMKLSALSPDNAGSIAPLGPGVDKRQLILRGALEVFLEGGYAGTSMDTVARRAGVAKQTIYSHFKDKESLFKSLIDQITFDFSSSSVQEELFALDARAFLPRFATMFLGRMDNWQYIAFMRLLIGESARFPELAHAYVERVAKPGLAVMTEYFRNSPELNFPDPEAAARVYMGSMVSLILTQEVLHGKRFLDMSRERYASTLVDIMLFSSEKFAEQMGVAPK